MSPTSSANSTKTELTHNLALLANGEYRQVHTRAIKMIHEGANEPVAYCLLGTIAADHGNHFKACELYEKAAKLDPHCVYYHAFWGQSLTTIGRQNEAKKAADHAATLPLDSAHVADTIGVIYSRTGYHEKAISFFNQAVKLNSEPANFHYNLGASLQFLGRFDEAQTAYHKTLERDRTAYRAWSSLVGLKRQTLASNHLITLKALFDELQEDVDATLHLGHAIAKTLEDLEDYQSSLDWLHRAKRLKKASMSNVSLTTKALFEAAKLSGPSAVSGSVLQHNTPEQAPIFVVGLPRTGTTLVDRILSSHSQVTGAGELNVFPGLIKEASGTRSNMVLDSETMHAAATLKLHDIGRAYLQKTEELARGAPRLTDKMPLNFFYAGLIHHALPNAKIVVLRRGAMDSCLSNYRQLLTVQHSYYQYTYDLNDTAEFYRHFDDLMTHWRDTLPANRLFEIRYEDIVFDQENQTRNLLAFCDLDWEDACLYFHQNTAPVSTASSVQVRQPLYSGSIGRWKRYGDKLASLQLALGNLADEH